jgi:hypothetical protein
MSMIHGCSCGRSYIPVTGVSVKQQWRGSVLYSSDGVIGIQK